MRCSSRLASVDRPCLSLMTTHSPTSTAKGAVAMREHEAEPAAMATREPGDSDATALKRQLGSMGYAFNTEAFFQAIGDYKPKAVELFLQAGMNPNVTDARGKHALN